MGFRLPRPLKGLRSLILAWKGDGFELYRISYEIEESDAVGAFVWIEGPDTEPTPIANAQTFHFDSNRTFVVDEVLRTTINGEQLPVYDLVAVNEANEDEVVRIPEKFLNQRFPPIDRKDDIFG